MENDERTKPSTNQKALKINLDPLFYGTFAEIGAGQEVDGNVGAIRVGLESLRDAALHVGDGDGGSGDVRGRLVGHGAQDAAGVSLREGRKGKEKYG